MRAFPSEVLVDLGGACPLALCFSLLLLEKDKTMELTSMQSYHGHVSMATQVQVEDDVKGGKSV